MARKTKVRIVGDPALAEKILACLEQHFECTSKRFGNMPSRYVRTNPTLAPGISIYLDIKRKKRQ